jgi:formyl-CoA transferase
MAITGEPDGEPMKVGVAVVDITTGMFTALPCSPPCALAIRQRRMKVDASCSLWVAWLGNVGQNYRVGQAARPSATPIRTSCPPGLTRAINHHDRHWQRPAVQSCAASSGDPTRHRFALRANPLRVEHRETLIPARRRSAVARPANG